MGSVCGTIKDVIDEQRQKGKKVGLLKLITYRPFPKEALYQALKKVPFIGIVEKAVSLGADGPLYTEIKSLLKQKDANVLSGFVAGLGGRDITKATIENIIDLTKKEQNSLKYMDLNKDLLWEEFRVI